MSYLYQGLAGSRFTTECSPRTYQEREAAIRKNIEWETGGIARGVSDIATNKTRSSVLNVARSYVRDNPPEELPVLDRAQAC